MGSGSQIGGLVRQGTVSDGGFAVVHAGCDTTETSEQVDGRSFIPFDIDERLSDFLAQMRNFSPTEEEEYVDHGRLSKHHHRLV